MSMLCLECLSAQFCRRWKIVSDIELSNPYFILDARNFVHDKKIPTALLIDELLNALSRTTGTFKNGAWVEQDLNFELFEASETSILNGSGANERRQILDWIDYNFGRCWNEDEAPNVGRLDRERFRVIASAVRAIYWSDFSTRMWGIRAANDN